jgi:hypothetical protein
MSNSETRYMLKPVEVTHGLCLDLGTLFSKNIFDQLSNLKEKNIIRLPVEMQEIYRQWQKQDHIYQKQFNLPEQVGGTWEMFINTLEETLMLKINPGLVGEITERQLAELYQKYVREMIPQCVEEELFNLQSLANAVILEEYFKEYAFEQYGEKVQNLEWVEANVVENGPIITSNFHLCLETL